jgi:hypothetical protein
MVESGLRTADALAYAGIQPRFWTNAMTSGLYTEPPPLLGRSRFFLTDDLVALDVLARLVDIGVIPHKACRIASDLRAWLRKDNRLRTLHLVIVADGSTTRAEIVDAPPEDSTVLWTINVAKARRAARQAIATRFAAEDE